MLKKYFWRSNTKGAGVSLPIKENPNCCKRAALRKNSKKERNLPIFGMLIEIKIAPCSYVHWNI